MALSNDTRRSPSAFALTCICGVCLIAEAQAARAAILKLDPPCVVGTGTSASCTEMDLDECLPGGAGFTGAVAFNCGPNPVTITITITKTITADTSVDGGNLVTISGGHNVLVFTVLADVNTGVAFTVTNLTIADGRGAYGGSGGISNSGGGTLTLINSTLSDNGGGGIDNGGDLMVTNSTFSGNSTDPGYGGGGIANLASGTLTVSGSTFSGNQSAGGAGIYNAGMLTVVNSTFSGNSATTAGGIYNDGGTLMVTGSTFANNSATSGGGIWNSGDVSVTNCTFSGNTAYEFFGGDGGGLSNSGHLDVTNCTFWGNTARSAFGPLSSGGIFNNGTATVVNSILANDTFNCGGALVTDGGHNIESGATCGFTANGSLSNTNPGLDSAGVASNGGPTQTIALQAFSPAINAGDESVCDAPPVNNLDQRGYSRPGTGATRCSIGAYEYHSVGPGPTLTPTPTPTITPTRPTPTRTATPTVTPTRTPGGLRLLTTDADHDGKIESATLVWPGASHLGGGLGHDCAYSDFGYLNCTVGSDTCEIPLSLVPSDYSGDVYVWMWGNYPDGSFASDCQIVRVDDIVCVGDCDGSGKVTVEELVKGVTIALGNAELSTCPEFDCNQESKVSVDCLVKAVNTALKGCMALPRT